MAENKSTSFEASLGRLEAIVKELEAEGIELERSVELFKEGRGLVARCEVLLKNAEETLKAADGSATAPPSERGENGRLDDEMPF